VKQIAPSTPATDMREGYRWSWVNLVR
jgi:hypothetical protein